MFSTLMHIPSFRLWLNRLFLNGFICCLSLFVPYLIRKRPGHTSHTVVQMKSSLHPVQCQVLSFCSKILIYMYVTFNQQSRCYQIKQLLVKAGVYTNLLAVLRLFLLLITHYGFLSTSQQPASLPLSMSSLSCYHLHHHSLTCHVKFLIPSIAILPSLILTRYQHAAHACYKLEYAISPQALLSWCGILVNFRRKVFPTH